MYWLKPWKEDCVLLTFVKSVKNWNIFLVYKVKSLLVFAKLYSWLFLDFILDKINAPALWSIISNLITDQGFIYTNNNDNIMAKYSKVIKGFTLDLKRKVYWIFDII